MTSYKQFAILFSGCALFLSGCASTHDGSFRHVSVSCDKSLDASALQRSVAPATVRVVTQSGWGSGFVVESTKEQVLIVTNLHVIENDDSFEVVLQGSKGDDLSIGGGSVVKVDTVNDLALLRLPAGNLDLMTLPATDAVASLGQSVVVFGYPGVKESKPTLTLERGEVTALTRSFEHGPESPTYVQTNANVNPGNSGGPVVDACGNVIGVASAIAKQTERTALFVPSSHLLALIDAYHKPAVDADVAIRSRIAEFLRQVRYKENRRASNAVSRTMLASARPAYAQTIESAAAFAAPSIQMHAQENHVPFDSWPVEEKLAVLNEALEEHPLEQYAFQLAILEKIGAFNEHTKLRLFVIPVLATQLQELDACSTEKVEVVSDSATAYVTCSTVSKDRSRIQFSLAKEWGDWVIADLEVM